MHTDYRIFSLGDGALTVDFGNRIDEAINARVLSLFARLRGRSPHIVDLVPAYSSLTVFYDVSALRGQSQKPHAAVQEMIETALAETASGEGESRRLVKIPVCYSGSFAPDIDELAASKQLAPEEVVRLHTARTYCVYTIGFLPGFAYMATVDDRIAAPRKSVPRTTVPAGAVGIAGHQTGIYPLASPGGWNLVGQTPLKLFDANNEMPTLLQPGDRVQFYSISENEFADYQSGLA